MATSWSQQRDQGTRRRRKKVKGGGKVRRTRAGLYKGDRTDALHYGQLPQWYTNANTMQALLWAWSIWICLVLSLCLLLSFSLSHFLVSPSLSISHSLSPYRFRRVLEEAIKLAGLCVASFLTRPYISKIIEMRCFKYDWVEYYIPAHVNNNDEHTKGKLLVTKQQLKQLILL